MTALESPWKALPARPALPDTVPQVANPDARWWGARAVDGLELLAAWTGTGAQDDGLFCVLYVVRPSLERLGRERTPLRLPRLEEIQAAGQLSGLEGVLLELPSWPADAPPTVTDDMEAVAIMMRQAGAAKGSAAEARMRLTTGGGVLHGSR